MALVQLIDPDGGQVYDVDDSQAEDAAIANRLVPATPEQVAEFDRKREAEKRSGGIVNQLATAGEEAVRKGAAGASLMSAGAGEVDAMGNPIGLVDRVPVANIAPAVFTPEALERREVNPTAAALGGSYPAVVAGATLPMTGPLGLAAALGLDVADAAAQEALDAELAGEEINGNTILRNAALSAVFSGAAAVVPPAARALLRGGQNTVDRVASAAASRLERFGAEEIAKKATKTVEAADEALSSVRLPKVANNPNAQRAAIEQVGEAFAKLDPDLADSLKSVAKRNGSSRFKALSEVRENLPEGEGADAIDALLARPELWGQKVLDHVADMRAARSMRPADGAGREAWLEYADALRRFPELEKQADRLRELADTSGLEALKQSAALESASEFLADKVAGKAVRAGLGAAGLAGGGPLGGLAAYAVGAPLEAAAGRALKPVVQRGLMASARKLKELAEADRRLTAQMLVNPKRAQGYARVFGDSGGALERFRGDNKTDLQAFTQHREAILGFQRSPGQLMDLLTEEFEGVDGALNRQMQGQALRVAAYLGKHLPPARGVSVTRPNGSPPNALQVRQWALRFSAATDPTSVMADARAGRLRREQVETLKELWPEEYDGLRLAVVQELMNGRSTPTARQRLNLLFGFDGSIDSALSSRIRKMVADARARNPQAQGGQQSRMTAQRPPSNQQNLPAGESALQLGASMGR
jgi:hypothetical protein